METILNFLKLDEKKREVFLESAPGAEQYFFSWDQIDDIPKDILERTTVVIGAKSPRILKKVKNLKWLQTQTAGTDRYTKDGVFPENAILTSAVGAYGFAVSEHMLTCMLALMKRLPVYRDHQSAGIWADEGRAKTLLGARVFLIGTGDIGRHLAGHVKELGAYTVGFNRHPERAVDGVDEVHAISELDQLLPEADVIAMSLPHSPETVNLLDARRLNLLKEDAILVNAGRGDSVDNIALAEVLKKGKIWGAALDVTEPEPLSDTHPLWSCPNLLLTPHVAAGHLEQIDHVVISISLENLKKYMNKEPLRNQVI